MATSKNYTRKQVISRAKYMNYLLAVSFNERRVWSMLDMRFNFDKEVKSELLNMRHSQKQCTEIKNKVKNRRGVNKVEFVSIFDNPLVKDYISNKTSLIAIHESNLRFTNGRNHWAKTSKDIRILSILKRNFAH